MDFQVAPGNTPLNPTEAEGLIPKLSMLEELNQAEGFNILSARRWANEDLTSASDVLSSSSLRKLHLKMFDRTWRWAGKYRVTQKSIGIEAFRIASELEKLVANTKTWIEFGTYSPLEIAVRFHHRLVQIHAFPNGNGRHARLATDLLCQQLGIELFSWGSHLKEGRVEVRRKYITALQKADNHEFEDLLVFVQS
ncbi:MAG: mobile mystery protein B [Armatimonadota bacterium]